MLSNPYRFEYSVGLMATRHYLEFESPLQSLDEQIALLESRRANVPEGMSTGDLDTEIAESTKRLHDQVAKICATLSPWQRVQLSRHPDRPYALDYLESLLENFVELHGDRRFSEDPSIVGGLAQFRGRSIVFLGQQKGRGTKQKILRNFGMPRPEGYRKALRLMNMAEQFGLPVITLVDTPGAYPGMGAEERGQSQAIAENLERMSNLRVPLVSVVIGEGGSGGALALAMGDHVAMMENAIYSVISPESCAAILWKDAAEGPRAANELKIGARDALKLGVIDQVIDEPVGGAHRDAALAMARVGDCIEEALTRTLKLEPSEFVEKRYEKFRRIGVSA